MTVLDIPAVAIRGLDTETYATLDQRFPARWSPRAMSGEALTTMEVDTLLEAARWAPSCFNAQPWRFAYSIRGDDSWSRFFDALIEANQTWARNAGALIAVAARSRFEHNDNPAATAGFDAGAAWMSMALQAQHMGLVSHGMYGFDQDKARSALQLPEVYELCAIIAVGHAGEKADLPDSYREREVPSDRKPLEEIRFHGSFADLPENG